MSTASVCASSWVFVHTLDGSCLRVDRPRPASYADRMRWDALFNDMESQFAEADRLALDSEITERARIEAVDVGFADRLRGALGSHIGIQLSCGDSVEGVLSHAGADALVLDDGPHQVLIPYSAVLRYMGLGRYSAAEPSTVRRAIGLAHSLRALARDRAELTVTLASGAGGVRLEGVVDRVGKDYFDVASVTPGEVRRTHHVRRISTIPFTALAAIRSRRTGDL